MGIGDLRMQFKQKKNIYIGLSLIIAMSIFAGCCNDESGKIPITTSSCDAKDNYLKGKEFSDNLQKQEALVYFEKAIELDPEFALAYLEAGLAQSKAEDIFKYILFELCIGNNYN